MRFDDWIGTSGRHEYHVWLDPLDPLDPSSKTHDGHRRSAPSSGRDGGADPESRTPGDQNSGGTLDPVYSEDETEPAGTPRLVDAASLRLSGRDADGKNFEARIWGGSNPQMPEWSGTPDPVPVPGSGSDGLQIGWVDSHVSARIDYQSFLDKHYRKPR